jgi:nitronate monooxygenase
VAIGTRFLASKEIEIPAEEYRDTILGTKGGDITTARSTVLDELKGKNMWPSKYDGRAIDGASYKDALPGVNFEDLRSGMLLRLKSLIKDSEAKEEQRFGLGLGLDL